MTAASVAERSGTRDLSLSQFHRYQSMREFYYCDLDKYMYQYNKSGVLVPCALCETKQIHPNQDLLSYAMKQMTTKIGKIRSPLEAQLALANRAKLPFYMSFYSLEDGYFLMIAMNDIAQELFSTMASYLDIRVFTHRTITLPVGNGPRNTIYFEEPQLGGVPGPHREKDQAKNYSQFELLLRKFTINA